LKSHHRTHVARPLSACAVGLGSLLVGACLDRDLAPLNPCLVSTVSRTVVVANIDKVDLLFMVDNSDSMTSKQNSLKAQFPHMIQVLSTGMRTPTDPAPFPAVKDMHLAVVSSDMGTVGQQSIQGCDINGGDDGRLKHVSSGDPGCLATYPSFLTYNAATDDPTQISVDFACIASLGVGGCNYEQQLESPFKALWPSVYTDANGNVVIPNPYTFLATTPAQTTGRGDLPPPDGSQGFLRAAATSPSLLGIVLLSDEDDQSAQQTDYLRNVTDRNDPLSREAVQVKPFLNPQFLYPVTRYIDGFKKLRPGNENLVVFAAIAGVPTDLVDARARMSVDFSDEAQRNAYYDRVAADPRMKQMEINAAIPQLTSLSPACTRTNRAGQAEVAVPAQRILQVVRGFGENGTLQSICADDYGPGMDAIIEIIAKQLGAVCLPRPLVRTSDGLVACEVVWELPPVAGAPVETPTDCTSRPFLQPVDLGRTQVNERGGANCKVEQLPVMTSNTAPGGAGWFYDTASAAVMSLCPKNGQQRVAFTDSAKPTNGVVVKLECLNEVQTLPLARHDISTSAPQPEIGSPCGSRTLANGKTVTGDAACAVALTDGTMDRSLFCHPQLNVCVQACASATDCPPAWQCDSRDETTAATKGKPYCANPTCSADN
jgi:hypothetical protein